MSRKITVHWGIEKVCDPSGVACYSECIVDELVVSVGDCVYVSDPNKQQEDELEIVQIKNLYESNDPLVNNKCRAVVQPYRRPQMLPTELTNLIPDLDLESEVIRIPSTNGISYSLPLNAVRGKCQVVLSEPSKSVKDVMETMPDKRDVYVCRFSCLMRDKKMSLVAVKNQYQNMETPSKKPVSPNKITLTVPDEFRTTSPYKKFITLIKAPPQRMAPPNCHFAWVQRLKFNLALWTPSNVDGKIVFKSHTFHYKRRGASVYNCLKSCPGSWYTGDDVVNYTWVTIIDDKKQSHTCDLSFDYGVFFSTLDGTLTEIDNETAEFNATLQEDALVDLSDPLPSIAQIMTDNPSPLDSEIDDNTAELKSTPQDDVPLIDLSDTLPSVTTDNPTPLDHRMKVQTHEQEEPLIDLTDPLPVIEPGNLTDDSSQVNGDQRIRDIFGDSLVDNWVSPLVPTVRQCSNGREKKQKTKIPTKLGFLSSANRFQ